MAPSTGPGPKTQTRHAAERDTDEARAARQRGWAAVEHLAPADLIVVEESGAATNLTRRYGRACKGVRVLDAAPQGHWRTLTLVGALGLAGVQAAMTVEGACDGEAFRAFVDHVLTPRLRPGQVVVMDNLSVHTVAGVRTRIEATGARLLYLPPYSPDFNPIESCWSKVKEGLRAAKARTLEVLEQAVAAALAAVTPQDARGWFQHCGYAAH